MAVQDQHLPAPWIAVLLQARSALPSWPAIRMPSAAASRARFLRVMGSDLFAFGLGGVLWSALIFVVVRSPV